MKAIQEKPRLRTTVAIGLLFVGLIGVILPIIPGWPFIGVALYLFSIDSPKIQGFIARHRFKHVSIDKALKLTYDKLHELRLPSGSVSPNAEPQA